MAAVLSVGQAVSYVGDWGKGQGLFYSEHVRIVRLVPAYEPIEGGVPNYAGAIVLDDQGAQYHCPLSWLEPIKPGCLCDACYEAAHAQ